MVLDSRTLYNSPSFASRKGGGAVRESEQEKCGNIHFAVETNASATDTAVCLEHDRSRDTGTMCQPVRFAEILYSSFFT